MRFLDSVACLEYILVYSGGDFSGVEGGFLAHIAEHSVLDYFYHFGDRIGLDFMGRI